MKFSCIFLFKWNNFVINQRELKGGIAFENSPNNIITPFGPSAQNCSDATINFTNTE